MKILAFCSQNLPISLSFSLTFLVGIFSMIEGVTGFEIRLLMKMRKGVMIIALNHDFDLINPA